MSYFGSYRVVLFQDCKIPPREFLGKFWTDSLVHDPDALKLLIKVVGEDRIMLGTDYPFPLGEVTGFAGAFPGRTICETYPDDEGLKSKLFFDNAMQFLNLDPSSF